MEPRITTAEFASTSIAAPHLTEIQAQRLNALQARDEAFAQRLRGAIAGLFRAVAEYPRRRRVFDELSMLSDRELADIGLNRADIPHVFEDDLASKRGPQPANDRVAPVTGLRQAA